MRYKDILSDSVGNSKNPHYILDTENKVYIVYDSEGKEYSKHPFLHIWDSSPAKRKAQQDIERLEIIKQDNDKIKNESLPLNEYEKEYLKLSHDNKVYHNLLFPIKNAGYNTELSKENILRIEQEIDKNYKRMGYLSNTALNRVRQSVILGTYKHDK